MADDLDVVITVDRTELSMSTLSITNASGYYVTRDGLGPGAIQFRRFQAQSPFVKGSVPVHVVPDIITFSPIIRVRGTSLSDLETKIDILTEAFTQFYYEVSFSIEGQFSHTYTCQTADYTIGSGGQYEDLKLRSHIQDIAFEIPATA